MREGERGWRGGVLSFWEERGVSLFFFFCEEEGLSLSFFSLFFGVALSSGGRGGREGVGWVFLSLFLFFLEGGEEVLSDLFGRRRWVGG